MWVWGYSGGMSTTQRLFSATCGGLLALTSSACEVSVTSPEDSVYQGDGLVPLTITCRNPTASTIFLHDIRKGCGCQSIDLPSRDIAAGAVVTGTVFIAIESAYTGTKRGSLALSWSHQPPASAGGTTAGVVAQAVARYEIAVRPVLSADHNGVRLGEEDGTASITLLDAAYRLVDAAIPAESRTALTVAARDEALVQVRATGTPFSSGAVLIDVVRREASANPSRIRVPVLPSRAVAAVVRTPVSATIPRSNPLHPAGPLMTAAAAEAWYEAHGVSLEDRARYPLDGRLAVDHVVYSDRDGVDIGFISSESGPAARSVPVRLSYFLHLAPAGASTSGARP